MVMLPQSNVQKSTHCIPSPIGNSWKNESFRGFKAVHLPTLQTPLPSSVEQQMLLFQVGGVRGGDLLLTRGNEVFYFQAMMELNYSVPKCHATLRHISTTSGWRWSGEVIGYSFTHTHTQSLTDLSTKTSQCQSCAQKWITLSHTHT